LIQIYNDEKHLNDVDGDADVLGPGVFGVGLGAAARNDSETKMFSQELEQKERKPF
jgi:hypothetical protein